MVDIMADEKSFVSITVLDGEGKVIGCENEIEFKSADSVFVPANAGKITVEGECSFIVTTV